MEASNPNQDLSEEDLALEKRLRSYVNQLLQETHNPALQKLAVESLKKEMIASYNISDSLIEVVKLHKFLRPHYNILKDYFHAKMEDSSLKKLLADILSVLAIFNEPTKRESLKYRLLGSQDDLTTWDLGYVKKLEIEAREEYEESIQEDVAESSEVNDKVTCEEDNEENPEMYENDWLKLVKRMAAFNLGNDLEIEFEDKVTSEEDNEENPEKYENVLLNLMKQIAVFYMENNLEIEAVDLITEFDKLKYDPLLKIVNETNYKKTCFYITSLAGFTHCDRRRRSLLQTANDIQLKFKQYASVLRIALPFIEKRIHFKQVFKKCDDLLQKKQLCFMVARHGICVEVDSYMVEDEQDRKELQEIINNLKMSQGYLDLARDLEVMEPKSPEDIYKVNIAGVRKHLGDAFVNAFVNTGFGKDNRMLGENFWGSMINGEGEMSETASLGLIMLWNASDSERTKLHRHLKDNNPFVMGGALLGLGILKSSIKQISYFDMQYLLMHAYHEDHPSIRIGAIMGLGLTYAASEDREAANILMRILDDENTDIVLVAFAAISLGLVYVGGNLDDDPSYKITHVLSEQTKRINDFILKNPDAGASSEESLPFMRLICLGLGLLFLGKKKAVKKAKHIPPKLNLNMREYCDNCLQSCAYLGSGDVEMVQSLLANYDEETAVLGIAMVAMAEELGLEMAIRSLERLLWYGEQNIRKTVPLALSLLCISNPERGNVVNIVSRLTHDRNLEVAMSAIISLGLIGSGTNNPRIARTLRNLAIYYKHNDDVLFCIQISLGLLHLGKGLLTLNPYHSDRFLLSPAAIGGLVTFLHCCLDMRALLLGNYHFVLYYLVLAMQPRMLLTVDEKLKMIHVPVHIGKAVDIAGQAGQPRGITSFQTFETPVLLASGERAELSTDKYVPLSPIMEGFVILKHNPDNEKAVEE